MTDGDDCTAVIYARVSTDDKDQNPETQVRVCREYCERHGWTVKEVYTDMQSGKNVERDSFRTMKGRITEGDIDFIVARCQDRVSRDTADYEVFKKFLEPFRVKLRFTDNDAHPETKGGKILDGIMAGFAQVDNMKRGEDTSAGMKTVRMNGFHVSHPLRFAIAEDVPHFLRGTVRTEPYETVRRIYDSNLGKKVPVRTIAAPCVVITVRELIDYARIGKSVEALADHLKVPRGTLHYYLKGHRVGDYVIPDRLDSYLRLSRASREALARVDFGKGSEGTENTAADGIGKGDRYEH